jgi:hypothetical protein
MAFNLENVLSQNKAKLDASRNKLNLSLLNVTDEPIFLNKIRLKY